MHERPNRTSDRIPCQVPLRLAFGSGWVQAATVDLSRHGVRFRIPVSALGVTGAANFLELVRDLCRALPERTTVQFHPERLGSLVTRTLTVVRFALHGGPDAVIEIGSRLDVPLSEVDAAALGVALPHAGESPKDALARRRTEAPRARRSDPRRGGTAPEAEDEPRQLDAFIRTSDGPILRTRTDRVDAAGVVVAVADAARLGLDLENGDARALFVAFCERHGAEVLLELRDGDTELWTGTMRVQAVEVEPSDSSKLVLDFVYGRALRREELEALSLA